MAYTEPTASDLKMRYTAFAAVDDATIAYWLTDAHRYVDTSWIEADYSPALIAAAAHNMTRGKAAGIVADGASGAAAAGLVRWRSGTADMQFSESAAARAIAGGWESTDYGLEYLEALRRSKGGPLVTSAGVVPCGGYGYNGFAGPLPPYGQF